MAQSKPMKGYAALATFIASDKDKSTQIYRRFDRLAARNLLYLQSEVAELERLQDELDREDASATEEEKQCGTNLEILKKRAAEPDGEKEKKRFDVLQRTREKITEYRQSWSLLHQEHGNNERDRNQRKRFYGKAPCWLSGHQVFEASKLSRTHSIMCSTAGPRPLTAPIASSTIFIETLSHCASSPKKTG